MALFHSNAPQGDEISLSNVLLQDYSIFFVFFSQVVALASLGVDPWQLLLTTNVTSRFLELSRSISEAHLDGTAPAERD